MTAPITVYSKPACVQCDATKRRLTRRGLIEGLDFEVVDLTGRDDLVRRFNAEGHLSAPVVVGPTETWSGYRPDFIDRACPA